MFADDIARVCHEVNRAYCHSLADHTQLEWENAPTWQRESAIRGVQFRLKNSSATPADMHRNWCFDKLKEGWKYGPVKDVEKKEHPCLVPFADLPREQQAKDLIFSAIVSSLKLHLTKKE